MLRRTLWNPYPDSSFDTDINRNITFNCYKCAKMTNLSDGYFIHPTSEFINGMRNRKDLIYCKGCASDLMITCNRCCNKHLAVLGFYEEIEDPVTNYYPDGHVNLCSSCARNLDEHRRSEIQKHYIKNTTFKAKFTKVLMWISFVITTIVGAFLFQYFLKGFITEPFSMQYFFIEIITYLNPLFWMYLCLILLPKLFIHNKNR